MYEQVKEQLNEIICSGNVYANRIDWSIDEFKSIFHLRIDNDILNNWLLDICAENDRIIGYTMLNDRIVIDYYSIRSNGTGFVF